LPLIVVSIVAVGVAAVRGNGGAGSGGAPPVESSALSSVGSGSGAGAAASQPTGCFAGYFRGIRSGSVHAVEDGAYDLDVIGPKQSKSALVGLELDRGGKPVGAIRFAYVPTSQVFRIDSVVDARCRPTERFSNEAHPAFDSHVLENDGTVRIQLGSSSYDLRLEADRR
jgi:hypothetical protein